MRHIIALLIAAVLLFGCTGGGSAKPASGGTQLPQLPGAQQPAACEPAYSFSGLQGGVLSQTTELTATVTCGGGKTLVAKIDGSPVATAQVATNATQPVTVAIPAEKDGNVKLTVEVGPETVFSRDWNVKPLGSEDISGLEMDSVSFKEWRAMALDVGNGITAGEIQIYMKRLQFLTQEGTAIVVELRKDGGGRPGEVVTSAEKPITATTLSDNWVAFELASKPALQPGRYWVVTKVKQTKDVNLVSDVVQVHYVAVDKRAPGNDYTREMKLTVDEKSGVATETEWKPLAYDRKYSIILKSG